MKIAGMALAGIAINPLESVAVNDDYYINKKLGIVLKKPNGWQYLSLKSFREMQNEQILPVEDENFEKEIRELMDPILVISKYPDIKFFEDRFSPGASVYCELFHFQYGNTLLKQSYRAAEGFKNVLTDYKMTQNPKILRVSNCDAVEMNGKFLFTHKRLSPIPVELKTVMVYQNPILYTLHMFDSKYLNDKTPDAFEFLIENFKLV